MKKYLILIVALGIFTQTEAQNSWPVLKTYDQQHLKEIKLPLGGIGTGTVSLTGNGALTDWEIMNRPAKGYYPTRGHTRLRSAPFFSIYVEDGDSKTVKVLEGPIQPSNGGYEGQEGSTHPNHGLPRFSSASFAAAYPFGQVYLKDKSLPVAVTIKAFNPLIPGNAKDSGIPMAIFTYEVKTPRLRS